MAVRGKWSRIRPSSGINTAPPTQEKEKVDHADRGAGDGQGEKFLGGGEIDDDDRRRAQGKKKEQQIEQGMGQIAWKEFQTEQHQG